VLSDDDLETHLDTLRDLLAEGIEVHAVLHGAPRWSPWETWCLPAAMSWGGRRGVAFEMLSGLSGKSMEPAQGLADLARMAKDRPAVRRLLEDPDEDTPRRLAGTDPEFSEALSAYNRTFARRALRYEVVDPSMAEEPAMVLRLIRDQLERAYDPWAITAALNERRERAVVAARSALSGKPAPDRTRFETALARAQSAYPVREENEFYTISTPFAALRASLLELGRRLTARA
jgi:pyruvate,water dikinase